MLPIFFALVLFKKWLFISFPTFLNRRSKCWQFVMLFLLLQWFCYFHHLPNFVVSDPAPEPSRFLSVIWLLGVHSLSLRILRTLRIPRAWCVYMGVGVGVFKGPTASFLPSFQSLLHALWCLVTHSFPMTHHLLWNWSMSSPRLPVSSAWSFNSKTEKCFPKEMSDITSFPNCLSYP